LQSALNLLEGADIQFRRESRLDIALVKNLPIALVFLPAADIPTFVGEGRVSLGITGRDTVAEHAAGVETERRGRVESGNSTPTDDLDQIGCEEVMDLGFGACKLQVQVPEKGQYVEPKDLIGKNIGTSFVHLTEEYFAALEREQDASSGQKAGNMKLKTKIIELSGSVEAACALGVADGIVDLVGEYIDRSTGKGSIDNLQNPGRQ
jgi:ATP phosphoribosyltransferase